MSELRSWAMLLFYIGIAIVIAMAALWFSLAMWRVSRRPEGMLSPGYDPDQEMRRYKSMTRNEP